MNINWLRNYMPWRVRLWVHLFFVKYPMFYSETVRQKKRSLQYNTDVFQKHMEKMQAFDLESKVLCELGPGDSMLHALQAFALGCEQMWLLDIDDLAGKNNFISQGDIEAFKVRLDHVDKIIPCVENKETWEHYLKKINGVYLTNGLESYYEVPDKSVDYLFSQSVLEHIRLDIFKETIKETYRICKQGGKCSHVFDVRDHLGGAANHLRFSKNKWESDLYKAMPNYVNRLSVSKVIGIFEEVGFEIISCEVKRYNVMPIKRKYLDREFSEMTDEELMICEAWIVAEKK